MKKELTELHLQILEKGEIECADVEELLGDLVDGELTPTLENRVRDYIDSCEHCQESEASYRWVVDSAKLIQDRPVSVDVQNRLRSALNERLGLSLKTVQ